MTTGFEQKPAKETKRIRGIKPSVCLGWKVMGPGR